MTRRVVSALFVLLLAFTAGASPEEASSPAALSASIASQLLAECGAARAKTAAVSIAGAPGLEGAPAVLAAARLLEDRLFAPSTGLAPEAPGNADVEVALVLSRTSGRVALGGGVRSRSGRSTWVLASEPETPAWAPWLLPLWRAPAEASGFVWSRAGTLGGDVLDADGGDLDGDGYAEFVAVTRDELVVFRLADGEPVVVARTALVPADAAEVATRAPRAFVRVAPGAGGPGEVLLRFTDERRTRVFAWSSAGALEPRGERDSVILSARPTARGAELVSLEQLAPGTNHFVDLPKVKRGATWKTPASVGAWLDLRDADVTATTRIVEGGAAFALLGADGVLRLLRSDLSELSRVPSCGAAFALTDWDADGKSEALCAGASGAGDSLKVATSGGASWSASLDGAVAGLASGPQLRGSTAALAFVRSPDGSPGTAIWLLTRRAP